MKGERKRPVWPARQKGLTLGATRTMLNVFLCGGFQHLYLTNGSYHSILRKNVHFQNVMNVHTALRLLPPNICFYKGTNADVMITTVYKTVTPA